MKFSLSRYLGIIASLTLQFATLPEARGEETIDLTGYSAHCKQDKSGGQDQSAFAGKTMRPSDYTLDGDGDVAMLAVSTHGGTYSMRKLCYKIIGGNADPGNEQYLEQLHKKTFVGADTCPGCKASQADVSFGCKTVTRKVRRGKGKTARTATVTSLAAGNFRVRGARVQEVDCPETIIALLNAATPRTQVASRRTSSTH